MENDEILIENIKSVTKEAGETRVEPFHSFNDLKAVQDWFWDNGKYHHWLAGWLMASLGRRVGDIMNLKWSDILEKDGQYKDRLTTLKEEKTGKITGVRLNKFARDCISAYAKQIGISLVYCSDKIFRVESASIRAALKCAVKAVGITYRISCHS